MSNLQSERQKIEEYLKFYCINEVLDEVVNELVETRPVNPYVAMCGMMERHTMPEIVDVIVGGTFVGLGNAGVTVTVITNIGSFSSTAAYPYTSQSADPSEAADVNRDYSRAQDSIRNALCKLDPRDLAEVDKLVDGMPEIDNTVALAVSMACCRAGAKHKGMPLYRYLNICGIKEDDARGLQMARLHMKVPLPVASVLSRKKAEAGSSSLTQEVTAIPIAASSVESALGLIQNVNKAVVRLIDDKKVLLGPSDSGCTRAVLPHIDDAVRVVHAAIESTANPTGVKMGIDNRAHDFSKITEPPPPAADAPADAPPLTAKVDYFMTSAGAPPGPIASASAAAAVVAAPVAAAPAKGKGKPDPKAAAAAPVEAPVATGDSGEVVMARLLSLWKECEFISVEDPLHTTADMDTAKTIKQRVSTALAEATSAEGADAALLAYSRGGVGGQSGCLLQVVLDASCVAAEDVKALAVRQSGGSFNAVKIRLDQMKSVGKTLALCKAVRDAGLGMVLGCNEGSPETLDTFVTDLAVAVGAGQLAAGGVGSGEHFCKYVRLLEISKEDPTIPFNVGKSFRS